MGYSREMKIGRPKKLARTDFSSRLKALRVAAGYSQRDLARVAEMSRSGLIKIEQGQREPNWPTVLKLASALGVHVGAFTRRGQS